MTETFNENVVIDGSADDAQLRVQGHTSQTEPLQTWEDSSGDVLAQVTGDGRLQVGDDVGLASPDALVEAHRAEGSTSKPKRGFHALGRVSDALDSIAQWIVEELEVHGSDSLSALQTALRVRAANMNTGTPSAGAELRGADIEVSNDAMAGSATLPKATGLQVNVTNAAGKTIDEAVGLHVKLDNAGTINTPYAIYTEGEGAAHFDDYLEVKRPASVPGTPDNNLIRLYPKSDGKLYAKNWNSEEYDLTSASGSGSAISSAPQGWLVGFEVSCDGTSVSIDPGLARVDSDDYDVKKLTTLTIDPTTTGANGLDTGALANSTWYYVFVIVKSSDDTTAGLLSTSATAPMLPTGYDKRRRVGAVRTSSGGALYQQQTSKGGGCQRLVFYQESTSTAPFEIFNTNIATDPTYTDVDCSAVVPPTSRMAVILTLSLASGACSYHWREKGTTQKFRVVRPGSSTASDSAQSLVPIDAAQVGQVTASANVTDNLYIDVIGYYDDLTPIII